MRTVTHGRRPPNIAYKRPLANPSHHTDLTFPRPRRPLAVSASGAGQRKDSGSSEVAEILHAARNGHISISRQHALVPNAEALSHRARKCARARGSARPCDSWKPTQGSLFHTGSPVSTTSITNHKNEQLRALPA